MSWISRSEIFDILNRHPEYDVRRLRCAAREVRSITPYRSRYLIRFGLCGIYVDNYQGLVGTRHFSFYNL